MFTKNGISTQSSATDKLILVASPMFKIKTGMRLDEIIVNGIPDSSLKMRIINISEDSFGAIIIEETNLQANRYLRLINEKLSIGSASIK